MKKLLLLLALLTSVWIAAPGLAQDKPAETPAPLAAPTEALPDLPGA